MTTWSRRWDRASQNAKNWEPGKAPGILDEQVSGIRGFLWVEERHSTFVEIADHADAHDADAPLRGTP